MEATVNELRDTDHHAPHRTLTGRSRPPHPHQRTLADSWRCTAAGGVTWVMVSNEEHYRKYADELIRFAAALVGPSGAEDLFATSIMKAFESPRWSTIENKRAYLYRVVWNAAHSQRRTTQRRLRRESRVASLEAMDQPAPDLDVTIALRRLTVRQRAVVYLTYWLDRPPSDIARCLAMSQRTVERDLANARTILKELPS